MATCGHPGLRFGHKEGLVAGICGCCGNLDSPCGNLNTSPTSTLNMDSVGILIQRSKTPIRVVEEGYAGIREVQVLA